MPMLGCLSLLNALLGKMQHGHCQGHKHIKRNDAGSSRMTGIHLNHRRICDQPCSADKQKQCHIPESSSRHFPNLQVNCCQKCNKTQYNKAERDSHNYQGTLDMVQGDCTSASDIVLCNLILSPLSLFFISILFFQNCKV